MVRFWTDRRGSTALTFAFMLIPLIALTGAAVDFGLLSTARIQVQSALDETALAISKDADTLTAAQIQSKATSLFGSLLDARLAKNASVTATYSNTASSTTLTIVGSAKLDTTFLGLVGLQQLDVSEKSITTWSSTRVRVALVLDNTGSMADFGKITALKTASKDLITYLQSTVKNSGDVYVSVIPFARSVNAGTGNVNANWIRWTEWDADNGSYQWKLNGWIWQYVWVPAAHSSWNGCVMDRDQDYDTNNTAASAGNSATLYPASQDSYCPTSVLALTNDWTALNAKIDAMQPAGNTNQGIGLQWGFASLTNGPLAVPSKQAGYTYKDVIILLTDGLNTQNRWYLLQSQIDARQQKTCDNIKAAGITLYAIQVNTGIDPTSTMLQGCASTADKYYLLTSADQISAVFKEIGASLAKLRLAQ